jgi:alpha-galactosidase
MSSFKVYQSAGRPAARYHSGTTVYEECLHNGKYIGLYWSSASQVARENLVDHIPSNNREILSRKLGNFVLELDGQLLDGFWEYTGSGEKVLANGVREVFVELRHGIRPVTVKVVTGLDGSPFFSRRLEITNTGETNAALGAVRPFAGRLWNNNNCFKAEAHVPSVPFDAAGGTEYSVGHYDVNLDKSGGMFGAWGLEGNFVWDNIEAEHCTYKNIARRGHGAPNYIVKNNLTGEFFFAALAWSAGYEADLWYDRCHHSLSFELGPAGPAPQRVIAPGETLSTPPVHIGMNHQSFDEAVEAWYGHLRSSVLPRRPRGKEMFTVAGRIIEKEGDWILREIDIAAEMGAEAFMVDAGWYGSKFIDWGHYLGDWTEGDWLPKGGLLAVGEYARKKGMLFGLWMEAEAMSADSKIYAEHPEWQAGYDARYTDPPKGSCVMDYANPEAAAYIGKRIKDIIGGKKLDFFKLDHNTDVPEGTRRLEGGYAENQTWRHVENLYKIFDEARAEYPDTAFENCAAGGGRDDLGMLSRFHYASQSDWSIFPFSIRSINGLTLFLPPEVLCYYHNHVGFACDMTDLDTHLRVALFCSPIFVGYGAQDADRNTFYFDKVREYTALLKTFCRPIMKRPKVFHHTPFIGLYGPAEWCVLEYWDGELSNGYAGLFRIGRDPNAADYCFMPRGVKNGGIYEVTLYNSGDVFEISGKELAREGIHVRLPAANASELILFKRIK